MLNDTIKFFLYSFLIVVSIIEYLFEIIDLVIFRFIWLAIILLLSNIYVKFPNKVILNSIRFTFAGLMSGFLAFSFVNLISNSHDQLEAIFLLEVGLILYYIGFIINFCLINKEFNYRKLLFKIRNEVFALINLIFLTLI
jgi:hypothetical protein